MKYRSHIYDIFFVFYQMKYLTDVVESFIIGNRDRARLLLIEDYRITLEWKRGDFT